MLGPRTNQRDSKTLEVPDVASRDRRFTGQSDTGNLEVANLHGSAYQASRSSNTASSLRGRFIERNDTSVKIFFECLGERFL